MFHSFFFENCTFTYDLPDRQQFEERMSQLFIIQHFHQIEPTFSFYPYFFLYIRQIHRPEYSVSNKYSTERLLNNKSR